MLKTRALALTAAVGIATAATSAQAAVVLNAGSNAMCASGGCFSAGNSYQQTYSAGSFSGPVSISALQLSKAMLGDNRDLAVKVSFQLADGTNVSWGNYTLSSLAGDVVTIGGKAIDWDTSQGDLVLKLDLVVPERGGGGGGGGGGMSSTGWVGWLPGADKPGMTGLGGGASGALTTRLSPGDFTPMINVAVGVPEPASWALMILGFGASGALLRNSRRRHYRFG